MDKPKYADEYQPEYLALVKATCLYLATRLGDFREDLTIVGGLVPALLIDQQRLPSGAEPHLGTRDVDLGLASRLLEEGRYRTLAEALRRAEFVPAVNERGNETRQRWIAHGDAGDSATVDFLIPSERLRRRKRHLLDLERDFAAIPVSGLELAFKDRIQVLLAGTTILGERAERPIWVCGPGAFVVLKALAFGGPGGRGEGKDAYDLYYMLRNFGSDIIDVVERLRPLLRRSVTTTALEVLERDFREDGSIGPLRAARFLRGSPDPEIQADVAGAVQELLRRCRR